MAYSTKYYFSFNTCGEEQLLKIEQKDYSGGSTSLEGLLQSIRLQRQGDELLEAPIVKSSLSFSLVDRDGGMWEEFFTPDSTKYRVSLWAGGSFRWSGYVTPDSYEEDLTYRGSITITARDMVGHMADIPFDASLITPAGNSGNLASVYNIIEAGLTAASCPMQLDFQADGDREMMTSGNYSCAGWLADMRGCAEKNFYEVVEGLLNSLGLVMRWEETGYIVVTSIRDLPYGGHSAADTAPEYNIQFWNASGHRTLEPAYRMIEETLAYDVNEGEAEEWKEEAFEGNTLTGSNGWSQLAANKKVMAYYDLDNELDANALDVSAEDRDKYVLLYVVPQGSTSNGTTASKTFTLPPCTRCALSFDLARIYKNNGQSFDFEDGGDKDVPWGYLDYSLKWVGADGTTLYNTGGTWSATPQALKYNTEQMQHELSAKYPFTTPNKMGALVVTFGTFKHKYTGPIDPDTSLQEYWTRLGNVEVSVELDDIPKSLKVKTYYDEAQNYTLKREPMFGKCPRKIESAGAILNGFYLPSTGYPSVQEVAIGSGNPYPLPVVVDMEILSRHTRTTSTITGTIAPAGGELCRMSAIWWWGDRLMLLQGGTLDPVRNCIEGAILREFITGNSWTTDNYEIK